MERNKILKLSNTRWLILHKCVERLLKNWQVLQNYFIFAVVEDKLKSAETILELLNDKSVKAYLLFLKYALNYFNKFNALFQSRKILIHKLYENSQRLIYEIAQNFIKPEFLEAIYNINFDIEEIRQPLENVYVGLDCESFLKTEPLELRKEIKIKCLDFYLTAIREMCKRLPYNNNIIKELIFLQPEIALYNEGRNKIKDLNLIATQIGNLSIVKLANEWTILPSIYNEIEKQELINLEIDEMWEKILEFKNFNGEKMFPQLELLIQAVLSLPHSNAEAERIFSMVTDIKNKKRNHLSNKTVSAMCVARSSFQAQGVNCTNFEVDSEHLKLHNSDNIYEKQCNSCDGS